MPKYPHLMTSESVTVGHPDKCADQISDSILDAILKQDPHARVAAETLLAKGVVVVAGEVTTEAYVNIEQVVRRTLLDIGYNDASYGLDGNSVGVLNAIIPQSPEISAGVTESLEVRTNIVKDDYDRQGAGDQGVMYGYAVNSNTSFFPAPTKIAHMLTARLAEERRNAGADILLPDGKAQVTLQYEAGIPVGVETVLISTQHTRDTTLEQVQRYVAEHIIQPVIAEYNEFHNTGVDLSDAGNYLVNPAGAWHIAGPASDSGLTGRKILVDSYGAGGAARHGGGAYSGKDPSKVDRSAAYYGRYVAKNLVAAGVAEELELQVSYAIGKARPVSLMVDKKGRDGLAEEDILEIIDQVFDFRPLAIIDQLNLLVPRYAATAQNGHFGRNTADHSFTWELTDRVDEIRDLL